MTIENTGTVKQSQRFQGISIPVFLPTKMEQPMANEAQTQVQAVPQEHDVSIFDVKELYDLAYEEKAKGEAGKDAFKKILAEAVKLDLAYRRQLAKAASYKDKTKMKKFNKATTSEGTTSQVA